MVKNSYTSTNFRRLCRKALDNHLDQYLVRGLNLAQGSNLVQYWAHVSYVDIDELGSPMVLLGRIGFVVHCVHNVDRN